MSNDKRRSFLEEMPNSKKTEKRESIFADNNQVASKANKNERRSSFLSQIEPQAKESSQNDTKVKSSFIDDLKNESNDRKSKKKHSFTDVLNRSRQWKGRSATDKQKNSVFNTEKPKEFHDAVDYIKKNYSVSYNEHPKRIENMVGKLIPPTISSVSHWGDKAIEEQRDLVTKCNNLIREFNLANGNELLDDIIEAAGYQSEKNLFSMFKNKFKNNDVDYEAQTEKLKIHISGIIDQLDIVKEDTEDTILPLWMVSIAGVDETYHSNDPALEQALHSRRELLSHAYMNLETSRKQLEKVRLLGVKMLSRIDHIMNVTLPAVARNRK